MLDVAGMVVKLTPKGIRETTDQLRDFSRQAGKAEDANKELAQSGKAAEQAMYEFGARIDRVSGGPITVFKAALVGLPLAAIGKQLWDLGGGIVQTGRQFEVLGRQIEAVMGSESAAAQALAWIDDFTLNTPLQVEQVAEAFNMLKAIGIDPMSGALQSIVDATSFTAQGYEGLIGVTRQLGQAWAKERLSGEEVLRLRERFIPVFDILSEKLGKTTAEIAEMSEKGELGRREISLLLDAMGEKYAGAAALQMATLEGEISNLQQTITFAFREISEGGLLDAVKDTVIDVAQAVNEMVESGRLAEIGAGLGNAFAAVTEAAPTVLDVFGKMVEWLPTIIEIVDELVIGFASLFALDAITGFVTQLQKVAPALTAANTAAVSLYGTLGLIVGMGLAAWLDTLNQLTHEWKTGLDDLQSQMHLLEGLGFGEEDFQKEIRVRWGGGVIGYEQDTEKIEQMSAAFAELIQARYNDKALTIEQAKLYVEYEEEVDRLVGKLDDNAALQRTLNRLLEDGLTPAEDLAKAAGDLGDTYDDVAQKAKASKEALDKVDAAFASAAAQSDHLSESFEKPLIPLQKASDAIDKAIPQIGDLDQGFWQVSDTTQFTLMPALSAATTAFILTREEIEKVPKKLTETEKEIMAWSDQFQQSIVDIFGESFREMIEGDFDSVLDLVERLVTDLADTMIRTFIDGLLSNEGSLADAWERLFGTYNFSGEMTQPGLFTGAAGALAGAGMMYGGYQQGGIGGFLSGALGGMGAVAAMAPLLGLGPPGWIALGIGALVGGGLSFLGGGEDQPGFRAYYSPEPGTFYADQRQGFTFGREWGGLGFGTEQRQVWERNMNVLVDNTQAAYRQLLMLYEMPELFDLVGDMRPEMFDFEGTVDEFSSWIQDVWLPEAMKEMFWKPIRRGLLALGMNKESIQALARELADLPGEERLGALEGLVRTLKTAFDLLNTSFDDLKARLEMSAMDFFLETTSQALDDIALLQQGWEDMSLLERANDLETIGQIFEGVTQNTMQMLAQIQAVSDSVTQSFGRLREDLMLEEKGPEDIAIYAKEQIEELMDALAEATDPQSVAYITSEIQRYMQMIRTSGVDIDEGMGGGWGLTWRQWLFDQIDAAEALALERLEEMEKLVRERYEATQQAFERATQAVLNFADTIDPENGDGVGHGNGNGTGGHIEYTPYEKEVLEHSNEQTQELKAIRTAVESGWNPTINVTNMLDGTPIESLVELIVDERMREYLLDLASTAID